MPNPKEELIEALINTGSTGKESILRRLVSADSGSLPRVAEKPLPNIETPEDLTDALGEMVELEHGIIIKSIKKSINDGVLSGAITSIEDGSKAVASLHKIYCDAIRAQVKHFTREGEDHFQFRAKRDLVYLRTQLAQKNRSESKSEDTKKEIFELEQAIVKLEKDISNSDVEAKETYERLEENSDTIKNNLDAITKLGMELFKYNGNSPFSFDDKLKVYLNLNPDLLQDCADGFDIGKNRSSEANKISLDKKSETNGPAALAEKQLLKNIFALKQNLLSHAAKSKFPAEKIKEYQTANKLLEDCIVILGFKAKSETNPNKHKVQAVLHLVKSIKLFAEKGAMDPNTLSTHLVTVLENMHQQVLKDEKDRFEKERVKLFRPDPEKSTFLTSITTVIKNHAEANNPTGPKPAEHKKNFSKS